MPPTPVVSGREAVRAFERDGWRLVRQRGSHIILEKTGVAPHLSIPNHREVSTNTLAREIRKSGLTTAEFIELLNR
jgi:predicted RNA binding protein YcfA (HicA-like mRNA interferase family)